MNIPDTQIAVTLFNLREFCKTIDDLDKTLERVRGIGYEAIQISAVSLDPQEIKKLLDKHGLYVCATHENFAALLEDPKPAIDKLQLWECGFAAVGGVPAEYHNASGAKKLPRELEKIGSAFRDAGLRFGYHNHHWEFEKFTGKPFLEEIMNNTDPELVESELDVHWVTRGGGNPEAWIRRLKGRLSVAHFKDYVVLEGNPVFCEIGEGNLDWPGILAACKESGVRWYSIEQDQPWPGRDIFDSIRISFNNLKAMGIS